MRRVDLILLLFCAFASSRHVGIAQIMIMTPAEGKASAFSNQAVIGRALPNMPIRLEVNGVAFDSAIVRID
jgi:hypothetical protein